MRTAVAAVIGWLIIGVLSAIPLEKGAAAPMPPEVAVNHATRQCAMVMRGDECVICSLPEGWVILGREGDVQCPTGYEQVELELSCQGARELRCCLPGHSGGQGDCIGLVLEGLLYCSPCLLIVILLVGLVAWLSRRRRRKHQAQETDEIAP